MGEDFFVDHQLLRLENGTSEELNYYMTKDDGYGKCPLYGIKVEKSGQVVEVEQTGPISYSRDWVLELCKKITIHQVTPISLLTIVDDILEI